MDRQGTLASRNLRGGSSPMHGVRPDHQVRHFLSEALGQAVNPVRLAVPIVAVVGETWPQPGAAGISRVDAVDGRRGVLTQGGGSLRGATARPHWVEQLKLAASLRLPLPL